MASRQPRKPQTTTRTFPQRYKGIKLPRGDCHQADLNKFLEQVQTATPKSDHGPQIFCREVSSRNIQHRFEEFGNLRDGMRAMFDEHMTLQDYSATVPAARSALKTAHGTLYLFASRDSRALPMDKVSDARFLENRATQGGVSKHHRISIRNRQKLDGAPMWHNVAVLVLRSKNPSDEYEKYFEKVYIYDPSYINEGDNARASKRLEKEGHSRVSDHLYLSTVFEFLKKAPKWAQRNTFIGGGGNVGNMNACRPMSCLWIIQTSELLNKRNRAVYAYEKSKTEENGKEYQRAHEALLHFFDGYTELRL